MGLQTISRIFRQLTISRLQNIPVANCHTTKHSEVIKGVAPFLLQPDLNFVSKESKTSCITFTARSVKVDLDLPKHNTLINNIIENPLNINFQIEDPNQNIHNKEDVVPNKSIEIPTNVNIIEKRAERLIVIRRKKMKKHKRKKFRKKYKFYFRKINQRRNAAKEKVFQEELQAIYQEAVNFDAKQYVLDRLAILKRERLPLKWKGEIVSETMMRQFLKERDEKEAERRRRREHRLKLDE